MAKDIVFFDTEIGLDDKRIHDMVTLQDLCFDIPEEFQTLFDFTMFDFVPETPNDAIQECIQEKVRIFNNSALPLLDYYYKMIELYEQTKGSQWNLIESVLCRQYVRQVYLELYVYREKLIRFLADIYHLKKKKQKTNEIFKMVKDKSTHFSFMNEIIEKIEKTKREEQYMLFDSIRNDEVHNITRIDRINYEITPNGTINPLGYKTETVFFVDNIIAVESFVKYVKENFLVGTVFTGIDTLNSAALRWLDTEANGTRNYDTKFIPRDMFLEEIPHLQKVTYRSGCQNNFRSVSAKYDVTWDGSRYLLDKALVNIKDTLRIEEENGTLLMYRVTDEKLVHHCQKAEHPGEKINTVPSVADRAVSLTSLKRLFGDSKTVCQYVNGIDKTCSRFKTAHYKWVLKLSKCCSLDELEEAMEHCIAANQCNTHELVAFLIYRHGEARIKQSIGKYMFSQCKQRAGELEQEATSCQTSAT